MFAPVVNRLEKYVLSDHPAVKAYTHGDEIPSGMDRLGNGRPEGNLDCSRR